MREKGNYTPSQVARMASAFLKTPFGEYFVDALSLKYNALHQQAEDETIGSERKAFLVERAAGVKVAIDYLLVRQANLDAGLVPEDKPA